MIDIIDNVEQGSDLWFKLRLASLGASSVKDAMACGQGKTRKTLQYKLLAEKLTGESTYFKSTPAMEEGTRREPESWKYFEFITGIDIEEVGLINSPDFPGQHISPDGINRCLQVGLELKNPLASTQIAYLDKGRLPAVYRPQVMFSLMITGWNVWYFMSYVPNLPELLIKVERDEKYIEEMKGKLDIFFSEMAELEERILKVSV